MGYVFAKELVEGDVGFYGWHLTGRFRKKVDVYVKLKICEIASRTYQFVLNDEMYIKF